MFRSGVPQRSVLDPLLFTIYPVELEDVVKRHGCNLHTYANDNHVYVHRHHSDFVTAMAKLEGCVKEVAAGWPATG